MSFSMKVKEELCKKVSDARHCRIAELLGLSTLLGCVVVDPFMRGEESPAFSIQYKTEQRSVAELIVFLIDKLVFSKPLMETVQNGRQTHFLIRLPQGQSTEKLFELFKGSKTMPFAINELLLQRSCCKRAFLKGIFLAAGSVSNPNKGYHFELVFPSEEQALQVKSLLLGFDVEAKRIKRNKNHILYIKEGSQIGDLLILLEAPVALMEFENVRILKEMRNSINRQVNCETANIHKTVTTAQKQIEAIEKLQKSGSFDCLKEELKEIAMLRLANPESSLKELSLMLSPPIGKSGVNHRLTKLMELAEESAKMLRTIESKRKEDKS